MSEREEDELHYYATILRRAGWTVKEPERSAKIDLPVTATDTQQITVARMNAGTFRETLLWAFIWAEQGDPPGLTDDEAEANSGRAHTTVSAARNVLARMGLVYDSGERRLTRAGNPAIVWRRTTRQALVQPRGVPRV